MRIKLIICLTICISVALFNLQAQQFGGNKPSIQWQQLNTPVSKVIYPKGIDTLANQISAIVNNVSASTAGTIGPIQKKISIVLQPNTIVSNGYVALAPFKSEFYLTPQQNSFELGSISWANMLATHEYRHVQQYNNFNVGLSKAFHILFGQSGQAVANALSVPDWFFEGDAVFQETLVSEQGRGRLPFFYKDYRSLWLANKKYSYMKLRNGSFKDFTPNHYPLGYMLVAYGRQKYGDDFWRKVTHDAASFKGLFYPFQKAVKKYSNKTFSTFTKDAFTYFNTTETVKTNKEITNQNNKQHFIGDQAFPVYGNGETIIYVNSSYRQIPVFIEKSGNIERKIRVKDVSIDNQFSYRNGKIVYASYRPHIRWGANDYNELQVLDVLTRKQKTITRHTKYFSPDISEDGKTIVAVHVQPGGKSYLHLLEAATGKLIQQLPNKENLFYTYPKFINNQQIVSAIRKPNGEMALIQVSTADSNTTYLTAPTLRVMGNPVIQKDTIYFTAADNEKDKLFAVTVNNKKIFQLLVTANGLGVYQPAVANNKIAFTSFTAYGYRLQYVDKNIIVWREVSSEEWKLPLHTFGISFSANNASATLLLTGQKVAPKKYGQLTGLFNFHSLLPFVQEPDYRISIIGNNVLNTMESELFVGYNRNEGYKQAGFNATYGGLYPYITAGANYIIDRKSLSATNKPVNWNEMQLNGGLSVPFNFSKGRSVTYLTLRSDYVFKNINYKGLYKDSLKNNNLGYISTGFSFAHQLQKARQHIYPRIAQTLYFNYRNATQNVTANQLLASGSFYWPGLFTNHNFVVNLAYQQRDTLRQYVFTNGFPFSRGYEAPNLRNMYKWGVNYHLPLAYPDWGFGGIIYFQRLRANVFYDHTVGKVAYNNGLRLNTDFRSAGTELFFDTKWWNQLPINFGFRYSHLLDRDLFGGTGAERFEFILPVNLFQR